MATEAAPESETRDYAGIVCPWCGHRHRDSFEMVDFTNESSVDGECASCEKPIRFRGEVHHSYICEPILILDDGKDQS